MSTELIPLAAHNLLILNKSDNSGRRGEEIDVRNDSEGPEIHSTVEAAPVLVRTVKALESSGPVLQHEDLGYSSVPNTAPKKSVKPQLPRGTKEEPHIICVSGEAREALDWGTLQSKGLRGNHNKRRPSCVKKDAPQYKLLLKKPVCTQDQMSATILERGEQLSEHLFDSAEVKCRYWDSFTRSNDTKVVFAGELKPREFPY
ncbi:hypothetical protein MHLP_01785 [Candidatus Mycoplasma haematolamae str. Purdue]|uniref:Uncharacterized protein n=1 Tax=Mycoplasma haematolamae (strain Purdue) TaxID=1212765 RepID=I7C626_MYCHA|nr:hypothetical protein [Candidatus Mycoplasma haematolamae]AFO51937.1 hypothetical protein MHLP_01785 [Candidatus Mycoplasma haematolamae str. Purdue]